VRGGNKKGDQKRKWDSILHQRGATGRGAILLYHEIARGGKRDRGNAGITASFGRGAGKKRGTEAVREVALGRGTVRGTKKN